MTAGLTSPRDSSPFSGKYAPNGGSQDDGKDNTADHDHDLLLLIIRRENYMRNGITVQIHTDQRRQVQLDMEEGGDRKCQKENGWIWPVHRNVSRLDLKSYPQGSASCPFCLLDSIPTGPLLPTRSS